MAKKPAPLTSDLLVRKGDAAPSSIDPDDRATANAPAEAEAGDDRPQTPEPEIVLAADDDGGNEQGSRRRLAAVLALVAIVAAGVIAVNLVGTDDQAPSVAPMGEPEEMAAAPEQTVAPVTAPSSPASEGAPVPPGDADLRLSPAEVPAPPASEPEIAVAPEPAPPAMEEPVTVEAAPVTAPREPATVTPQPAAPVEEPAETAAAAPSTPVPVQLPEPEVAEPAIAAPGQYLIQLLSVRSENAARSAWSRLQTRHSDLLGNETLNLEAADLGERGMFYRVRFGAFDARADANAVCRELKTQGQDCLVKRVN